MANLITLARIILLFVLVAMVYSEQPMVQLACFPLLLTIFLMDAFDGYVARKRHEESQFGALFDIAADRIVENVLWIVLADLDFIPIWVPLAFITRSILVDSIRASEASRGSTPFGMMRSPIGRFIVAGRAMRFFYGAVKAVALGYIFLLLPWPHLFPAIFAEWHHVLALMKDIFIYAAVVLCLVRGIPVMLEFALRTDGLFANLRRAK